MLKKLFKRHTKEDIKEAIRSVTKDDIDKEMQNLEKKPKKTESQLKEIIANLSKEDLVNGEKKYKGREGLIKALLYYMAFKAALVKQGIKVSVAAGASAVVIFGAGALCHSIASATGSLSIDAIGDGMDAAGEVAVDVVNLGIDIIQVGTGFLEELIDVFTSIL